ncbi:LodA/GoxA family CTQ-dependent oxidase [Micromonospora sp. DT47]|uniref:LodA/GoxA family CTQ-dependent oxidase n=1 Tax=Micromonospora sp. DT47 TaxID=3393431 RepID=UPI003CF2D800
MAQPPPRYRIHPAIGIARVGNADPNDYFIGPERPGQPVVGVPGLGTATPPFKSGGRVKRQAARFRIYEYTESGGVWSPSREVTLDDKDVVDLTWTVHLANRKASFFTFDGLAGSPLLPVQPARRRRNPGVPDRRSLEIDPQPRSISGKNANPVKIDKGTSRNPAAELWPSPQPTPAITSLGQLRTDGQGRLIVVPGGGVAGARGGAAILDYANNDGWFDDVCDGPLTARLRLKVAGKTVTVPVQGAWLVVGPPDFAPGLPQMVSLYDVLVDVAVRGRLVPKDESVYISGEFGFMTGMAKDLGGGGTTFTTYKVRFDEDVAPILRAAIASMWVFGPAQLKHVMLGGPTPPASIWASLSDPAQPKTLREFIFRRLRKPGTTGLTATIGDNMPKLLGDDPYGKFATGRYGLTLTETQYAVMERWSKGAFLASGLGPASLMAPPVPAAVTSSGLDRAALEFASGGAFFPGIEVGWMIREAKIFAEPFRVKHGTGSRYVGDPAGTKVGPGYFSRQMALPWLADFLDCKTEEQSRAVPPENWGWWPSQRPDFVYPTAAEAAARGTMRAWTRAQAGASMAWPPAPRQGPSRRPPEMPSYEQMVANWFKLAFVTGTHASGFAESERAGSIP